MEAPFSFQRIPERHIRCFTNILQAASVTPDPSGKCLSRKKQEKSKGKKEKEKRTPIFLIGKFMGVLFHFLPFSLPFSMFSALFQHPSDTANLLSVPDRTVN